jgi:hypothetical protein
MLADNAAFVEVEEATTAPATPTVTVTLERETSVDATTSAFSAGEGGSHTDTQWQITTAADTGFASPVYNPGDDAVNLTSITEAGSLIAATDYLIRARHKEDDTTYSAWSAAVAFSTTGNTNIRYVPIERGDTVVFSGSFTKGDPSDSTGCDLKVLWHKPDKSTLGEDTVLSWTGASEGRKQTTIYVSPLWFPLFPLAFLSVRAQATLDNGETCRLNYYHGWRNPPDFGLTATISLDGSDNVDLEWESSIACRVKYVANTTGYVSSANVEANGTFTESVELTSDTEEDVISALSGTAYVTLVPYDENDRRSGSRYLVPTISN